VYYNYNADGLSALYKGTEMSLLSLLFMEKQSMKSTKSKSMATKTSTKKVVANLNKVTNQVSFLEKHLRGTGRSISQAQAAANYGILNLSARMSEFRKCGLQVKTSVNTTGNTVYTVSARDVNGSRAKLFSAN